MRDNMEELKNKSSLDFENGDSGNFPKEEEQLSLNDDRRVKVLSPGTLVAKRFFRNRLAVLGLTMLIVMFLFSFVGGLISPYEEDEQFYTYTYMDKEYAGVVENNDLRYLIADGADFGSIVQAQFLLAINQQKDAFSYKNVDYEVEKLGEDLYTVSSGGEVLAAAYKDIINPAEGSVDAMSFELKLEALKAYVNGEASFTAESVEYTMDEDGNILKDGEILAYISRFVVQPVENGASISRNFKEELAAAINDGQEEFVYTDENGEESTYTLTYKPDTNSWSVMQSKATYVYDRYHSPSKEHWLGTDTNGMDMLTRLMYGGRVSLIIGFIVVFIAAFLGVILGGIAGYFGKWVDNLIMRIVDVFYCIPSTPLIIILGAAMDAMQVDPQLRMLYLMLILGFLSWPGIARLIRGQILSLREQEFMTATEACGISVRRRIFRHLIPNVIPQLIVTCTMSLGSTIITEATLSFLGLGVKFPFASWGNIINDVNNSYVMTNYWFIWIPAGICLLITVLGFNFVGDGLRDAFDPKMKR
ncbi:MAG: ABC transporter permease [Candidatus Limivivens sp.]|nr:ABC transporter permease [Candidatus Limivivens sp.]